MLRASIVQYYVASPMLINGHKCARSREIARDHARSTAKLRATAVQTRGATWQVLPPSLVSDHIPTRGRFSLRLYSLITCARPLRVYLYDEGFALFASDRYDETSDAR